jgi:hypothetical protein
MSQPAAPQREALRARYLPRVTQNVLEVLVALSEQSAADLQAAYEVEGAYTQDLTGELTHMAEQTADEFINRTLGNLSDQRAEVERGARARRATGLALATLALIGRRGVSSAYNAGRRGIMAAIVQISGGRLGRQPRVYAIRSAVLDSNTCGPCRTLDGARALVGSARYDRLTPPTGCKGGHRCRCVWRFQTPQPVLEVLT